MDGVYCIEALERYGDPEIFNTDQGVQLTSNSFKGILEADLIRILMDERGRYFDNIMNERF